MLLLKIQHLAFCRLPRWWRATPFRGRGSISPGWIWPTITSSSLSNRYDSSFQGLPALVPIMLTFFWEKSPLFAFNIFSYVLIA
jgi:hypothetical protein